MKLAVLCSGQGNQNSTMLDLVAEEPKARRFIDLLNSVIDISVSDLVVAPEARTKNINAQPLICAVQLAIWELIKHDLPEPKVFAGYSIGELSAYGCANALAAKDVIEVAYKRAALMDNASITDTTLIAVQGITYKRLVNLKENCNFEIAIINGSHHIVVGLKTKDVDLFCSMLENEGALVKHLPVEVASHTSWMGSVEGKFKKELEELTFNLSSTPVLAGISGRPVRTNADAIQVLSKQLSNPIRWESCMRTICENRCSVVLELGPGNGLSKMMREFSPGIAVRSVSDFRSLNGIVEWVIRNLDSNSSFEKEPCGLAKFERY